MFVMLDVNQNHPLTLYKFDSRSNITNASLLMKYKQFQKFAPIQRLLRKYFIHKSF